MTIKEFNEHNKNNTMPKDWIGQGYGYKAGIEWDQVNENDIIYIPDLAYEDCTVKRGCAFSKRDFINMVADLLPENTSTKDIDEVAYKVFETVDWQFPTSVVGEWHAWGWFDPTNDEYILKFD